MDALEALHTKIAELAAELQKSGSDKDKITKELDSLVERLPWYERE